MNILTNAVKYNRESGCIYISCMEIASEQTGICLLYTSAHRKKEQEKEEKYKAELLRAAKRADAANEAKTEFLQRMSHDIRTPINGICGMLDVADHYADDMDKQRECRTTVSYTHLPTTIKGSSRTRKSVS